MSSWGKGKHPKAGKGHAGHARGGESGYGGYAAYDSYEGGHDVPELAASSTVPWPPQDPEWWADLASQLPAAWGNGAFDTTRVKGLEEKLSPEYYEVSGFAPKGEGFYDAACPGSEDAMLELPPCGPMLPVPGPNMANMANMGVSARRPGRQWVVAEERHPDEAVKGEEFMCSESLLGKWVDSQGHSIHVLSTDAYNVRLLATLSKTMCPDKHLALKPVRLGAGWQCGHSILDPSWSTSSQLHWVAGDGRVTVWVRPSKAKKGTGPVRAMSPRVRRIRAEDGQSDSALNRASCVSK